MIEELEWDSNFFNCRIGKILLSEVVAEKEIASISKGFDLVYVITKSEQSLRASFKEKKLTYSKVTAQRKNSECAIRLFSPEIDEYSQLLSLVYLSGQKSRFLMDAFFGEVKFKSLYKAWIDKNLKSDNEYVIVCVEGNELKGFVSYRVTGMNATIELIAVNSMHQGKGIGEKLIYEVENRLGPGKQLFVSTQGTNHSAISFYRKHGFILSESMNIYHYQPHDTI